jgi:O-acetyl-ADP-ribose deacetylase (regulator of RNase III)
MENDRLEIISGDITKLQVDAIVNAANSSLLGGGGVDGAIHRAGGPEILTECRKIRETVYPEGMPAGNAVITGAGRLPAQYIIHTVGPVWHGGANQEDAILQSAYRNSLDLAAESNVRSIAFPAISTGVYGFPKERAAGIVYRTITDFLEKNNLPEKVVLCFYSESDRYLFQRSIKNTEQNNKQSGVNKNVP